MARNIAVIGGGPAGLMAAESARALGAEVSVYEQMPSPARKFLIAGKGGLNLTHSEPMDAFVRRYGERASAVAEWLQDFDANALRAWARGLGVETVVGSSGRVFPADYKAGPLLRAWVRRLRGSGVHLHTGWRWLGWDASGALAFDTPDGTQQLRVDATVLALGGASWSKLGADGRWAGVLQQVGVEVAPFRPSNCGFERDWTEHLRTRHAGAPIKSVMLHVPGAPERPALRGEFVLTDYGVEGSAIYALSAPLRDLIERNGHAELLIDLAPDLSVEALTERLARGRGKRSLGEHIRRTTGLDGARLALLYELADRASLQDPLRCAQAIKALALRLLRCRPIDEAISTAGGVRFDALTEDLQLRTHPGVWCAGEMIDWEAPTGGYLLTACMASGWRAGRAAAGAG